MEVWLPEKPRLDRDVDVWAESEGSDEDDMGSLRQVLEEPYWEGFGPFWIAETSSVCARRPQDQKMVDFGLVPHRETVWSCVWTKRECLFGLLIIGS